MAEIAQDVEVTNSGQPLVAEITPANDAEVAREMTIQIAANVTVEITPAQG